MCVGPQCLALDDVYDNLANGASVSLKTWQGWDHSLSSLFKWSFDLGGSSGGIHVGEDREDTAAEGQHYQEQWCLDSGDVDSDGSGLFIWECNGFPQQQFSLENELSSGIVMHGNIFFPNGKCLDGISASYDGNTPIVWDCNGSEQQFWELCPYVSFCGKHLSSPCLGSDLLTV